MVYGGATAEFTGAAGADEFEFVDILGSASGFWGTITDFSHADGDRIHVFGSSSLQFIGDDSFGVGFDGEVRVEQILGDAVALVEIDRDGDRIVDAFIEVTRTDPFALLSEDDFWVI